jgi:hypothetical protein
MPKFIIKKHLIHKGKIHEPGQEIALDDRKAATDLFNRGYIDGQEQQEQKPPPPPAIGAPASGTAQSAKPAATKADTLKS